MIANKYHMTWDEVRERMESLLLNDDDIVFGIPRGGMLMVGMMAKAYITTVDPEEATVFVDDIIDSGATRDAYAKRYPDTPFVAIVDKQRNDKDIGWVVFPWEKDEEASADDIIIRTLQYIGEDPNREGLKETPKRVLKAWGELFAGYKQDPAAMLKTFTEGACDEMVLLKNIEFFSTCEHHMIPFSGKAHIAYIPDGKVVGISKLARLLEVFARRLQIQERLGEQITSALMTHLAPKGAACILEAQHMCMTSRGIQKQDSIMVTSSLKGVFLNNPAARAELMGLIRG